MQRFYFNIEDSTSYPIMFITHENETMVKAIDISNMVGIKNMRHAIRLFNESEKKQVEKAYFLTMKGIIKILCISKKNTNEAFPKWINSVINEMNSQLQPFPNPTTDTVSTDTNLVNYIITERTKIQSVITNKIQNIKKEKKLKEKVNVPTIYIYNTDENITKNATLKIGMTNNLKQRILPYNTISPNGKIVYHKTIENCDLALFEKIIHNVLKPFHIKLELFRMDQEDAINCIDIQYKFFQLHAISDSNERQHKIKRVLDITNEIMNTEYTHHLNPNETFEPVVSELPVAVSTPVDPQIQHFEQFIREKCIVHDKAEVSAKDLVGAYRLYVHEAKKEVTTALFDYLKRKYKYGRLGVQDKNQVVNGFIGITLKPETYPRNQALLGTDADIFTFCGDIIFTPGGTAHWKDIWDEYQKWAESMKRTLDAKEDEKKLKAYLKSLPYLLYEVVWANNTSNQGFYGLKLKRDTRIYKTTSSTGCNIERVDMNGNSMKSFETIAKAAEEEKMCAAKMSRSVKAKVIFGSGENQYYYVKGCKS
jgi:T5orf172 domain